MTVSSAHHPLAPGAFAVALAPVAQLLLLIALAAAESLGIAQLLVEWLPWCYLLCFAA